MGGRSLASFINEAICNPEVLLCVFSMSVVDLDVKILEVFSSLHILSASYIEDVSDSNIYKLLGFETCLVRTHQDAWVYFEQVDFSQGNRALNITSADIHVRESSADYVVFFSSILAIKFIFILMSTCCN